MLRRPLRPGAGGNIFINDRNGTLGTGQFVPLIRFIALALEENDLPRGTVTDHLPPVGFLGCLAGWLFHSILPEWLKLGIGVGLHSGFTTMSTFAADTFSIFALNSAFDALKYLPKRIGIWQVLKSIWQIPAYWPIKLMYCRMMLFPVAVILSAVR
jgi:fluoride ion exporter CrcB/FEX